MDKKRRIRLVLIPIIVALVVTLVVRQLLQGQAPATTATAVETAPVVVATGKAQIPAHTKLTPDMLTVKAVPKTLLTGNEFTAVKDVVGQITDMPLDVGEIVLKSHVVVQGTGAMPYRIPEGTRAMTIRIDEFSGVAGYPAPGDLVDLVLYLPSKPPDRPGATSRLLYQSVLVLAKGPATQDGKENTKISSLTLALTPEAAVEVTLDEEIGHIQVLLRPALPEPATGKIVDSEGVYR